MSASGKIAGAAASMASMYHANRVASLYYSQCESYAVQTEDPEKEYRNHGLSIGYRGVQDLPLFSIRRPEPVVERALVHIHEEPNKSQNNLIQALRDHGLEPFDEAPSWIGSSDKMFGSRRKERNRWIARLRRRVMQPLMENQYVVRRPGSNRIVRLELTEQGRMIAYATGHLSEL